MMRVRWLISAILLLSVSLLQPSTGELPTQTTIERASRSVVQVQAQDSMNNKIRTASGFLWNSPGQVLTALHVVSGCDQILVYSEYARVRRSARIVRVLKSADLALLQINDAPNLPVLQAATNRPTLHDDLVALGYELGTPSMSSKNLKLSFGKCELGEMLPPDAEEKVRRAGTPSLSLEILRLQGHLVPGLSGAPIIDRTGRVAAVGDGGLENGAVSISWALPIENARRLLISTEPVTTLVAAVSDLYSAELNASRGSTFSCGDMVFTKMRTRTYSQLASSSDDPASMDFMRQVAEEFGLNVPQLVFDVYVHLNSGATIVLPQGMRLGSYNELATVSEYNRTLFFCVGGKSPATELLDALDIDASIYRSDLTWTRDPNFSYPAQQTRFDGLTIDRASYIGINPPQDLYSLMMEIPNQAAISFETEMSRGNTFVQVVVLNYDTETFDPTSNFLRELLYADTPHGRQVKNKIKRWMEMILGACLSTFPIG